MPDHRTVLQGPFKERQTTTLTTKLLDDLGNALGAGALATLTLTLYNLDDGAIINGKDGTNILNANGGVVDASGNLTLELAPADMAILDVALQFERHVALLKWTYGGGSKSGAEEVEFPVYNMPKVP